MVLCYEPISHGDGGSSPCLLDKGHNGGHEHEGMCTELSCICEKDYSKPLVRAAVLETIERHLNAISSLMDRLK